MHTTDHPYERGSTQKKKKVTMLVMHDDLLILNLSCQFSSGGQHKYNRSQMRNFLLTLQMKKSWEQVTKSLSSTCLGNGSYVPICMAMGHDCACMGVGALNPAD
jgi:hypothetical protein